MVFQRNSANQATFQVAGSFSAPIDRVEVQIVDRINANSNVGWTTLQTNPTNGQFVGTVTVSGGWYQINVRGRLGTSVVGTDAVDRVGVGEVFAILGHSNAQGTSCGNGTWGYTGPDLCPTIDGALDDRVSCARLNLNNSANFNNPAFDLYEQTGDNRYLPGLTAFEKYNTYVGSSPFSRFAWFWGKMGDLLVQQLGVPVLLYNAGFGGSRMQDVYNSAYDIPFQHGFIRYDIRMPYVNIRNIMNLYVPSTGLRAVLVQHGVNDRDNSTETIRTHYLGVIDKVRAEFNLPSLAWIVSKDSYIGAPFENVRAAQDAVINRAEGDQIYPGPDLDQVVMFNPAYSFDENNNNPALRWRPDGLHYSPAGQQEVAVRWSNVLGQQSLLNAITPVLPVSQPLASIACPTSTTGLTVTFPTGYEEYNWGDGTSNQSRSLPGGSYTVRLRLPNNRIAFPPAVTVPNYTTTVAPAIAIAGNQQSFCTTTVLSLTSTAGTPVRWNGAGATATSFSITTPGSYSAQTVDAVYGCVSAPTVLTIGLGAADLSLDMSVNKRVLKVGDEVTYAISMTNNGPCNTGTFSWRDRLPANVQFISSPDNLTAVNGEVIGTVAAGLNPNASITQRFTVRIQQPGLYLNAAEISAMATTDPNSVPNSGTGDGQNDAALTDLRTVESTTMVYASPNPNQTPLPAVIPNQPTPEPGKADLSLQLQSSRRVGRVGDPVMFSLTVSNRGGAAATTATVGITLPTGLTFVSSASGLVVNSGTVQGTVTNLAAGGSVTLTFVASATATGNLIVNAQVLTASPTDSDSEPGNGFTNGEDDTAQADIRVTQ
ncbi:DUF11 domain-containing protein [Rudanella paleaurantiibacter]|nr:DUF11 domain-containing protein [Rudanella paleaurantiibacter]